MDIFVQTLVGVNGLYDITCSLLILMSCRNIMSSLHIRIFTDDICAVGDLLWHRILAYWILTYGIVRLSSCLCHHPALDVLSAATYVVEALAYLLESTIFQSTIRHGVFLVVSCSLLSALQILRAAQV